MSVAGERLCCRHAYEKGDGVSHGVRQAPVCCWVDVREVKDLNVFEDSRSY